MRAAVEQGKKIAVFAIRLYAVYRTRIWKADVSYPAATRTAAASAAPSVAPSAAPTEKVITGPLKFANWPAYIDQTTEADADTGVLPAGSSKTLEDFKAKYKVEVDYEEKIEDNKTFYATIQPQLQAGSATGWDLIVITDWLAAKVISKGWAEQIIHDDVPNAVANLQDSLKNQPWDPDFKYHLPCQSGATGVG